MQEADLTRIFDYMGGTIRSLSGHSCQIGGRPDHIHILTSLPVSVSLADFVRKIKANTSKWIKQLGQEYKEFAWQEGYGAFSVSESNKETVVHYIEHQKVHHKTRTAHEEFLLFLEKHGLAHEAGGDDSVNNS